MAEQEVGTITHFFSNINVAVLKLSKPLNVGERLHFKGATTNFEQVVDSMQVEHKPVQKAKKGDSIGLKVTDRVREGDKAFLVK